MDNCIKTKVNAVSKPVNVDMNEVMRLTRAGRLPEALAMLRTLSPFMARLTSRQRAADQATNPSPPFSGSSPVSKRQQSRELGKGLFAEHKFANAAGSRKYKVYVPSSVVAQPMPLVIMLHGCTQCPDDFAAGTRMNQIAERQQFIVAYPAQGQSTNPLKCWNWFKETDQQRDLGEPSIIAGLTRQIMIKYPVDPDRVYIAGLSAGGATAVIMGATYPDLYAAVGVHSGLAFGAATDAASALRAMKNGATPRASNKRDHRGRTNIPTIVFHGDQDATVNPVNGDQVIGQALPTATNLKCVITSGHSMAGAAYTKTQYLGVADKSFFEHWLLHGAGHAWSGGSIVGSFTEQRGPDASSEMVRFFLQHGMPD